MSQHEEGATLKRHCLDQGSQDDYETGRRDREEQAVTLRATQERFMVLRVVCLQLQCYYCLNQPR
jgi:hypothetical protein